MSDYGLIGKKLGHSFSKIIHEKISDQSYDLIELDKQQFHTFMIKRKFKGINVTIPFKKDVMPYLDSIDEHALSIGAVNTVVQKQGKLYGYNTDYDGFAYMIDHHRIDLKDQKILVIGNGGAAAAIKAVCKDHQAKEIVCVSRHPQGDAISYDTVYANHRDATILINTSPVGMYPNVYAQAVDLCDFPECKAVIDVVYNPMITQLCLQAKEMGIPAISGLEMLIVQAIRAREHFLDQKLDHSVIEQVLSDLLLERMNFVLIGMPSAGKTTIGQLLSQRFQKDFIDLDQQIEQEAGQSIKEIFNTQGEDGFRILETQITKRFAAKENQIIACGGGIIKKKENIDALRLNGLLIYLDRKLELLMTKDPNRPLSRSKEAVEAMYHERKDLYEKYSHIRIENNNEPKQTVDQLMCLIHEKINDIAKTGGENI